MNSLCDEPNPLGDEILFFSADGADSYRKLVEASKLAQIRNGIQSTKNMKNDENGENATANSDNVDSKNSGKEGINRNERINIDIFGNNTGDSLTDNKRKNSSNSIFNNHMHQNISGIQKMKENDISNNLNNKNNQNSQNNKNNIKNKQNNTDDNENDVGDDLNIAINLTLDALSSTTVHQHSKYLLAYAKEADQLANDFADRRRMSASIGKKKIIMFAMIIYVIIDRF